MFCRVEFFPSLRHPERLRSNMRFLKLTQMPVFDSFILSFFTQVAILSLSI